MTKNSQIAELHSLHEELIRLSKETLPVKTRAAIESARHRLTQFERLFEDATGQDRLAALYRVSNSLGLSLNLDDVLTHVMDAVIQLTGAERGFLTMIDPDTGSLDLRAARNIEQESLQRKDMEISRTVVQSVIETGRGIVTTDAQTDPRFANQDSVVIYSLRSILCAPLQSRGSIIGVIYVDNRARTSLFTKDDLDLLSAFASQAAVAIENARLYTRTDQALAARIADLETMSQIDMQLSENLDLSRVTEIARQWALKGTEGSESWISLCGDEITPGLQIFGPQGGHIPLPEEGLLEPISDDYQPQIILANDDRPNYLIAPMLHARKTIGAIIVADPNSFSEPSAQFLGRLAARAAAVIENARLYLAVQKANEAKSQFVSIVTHELRIPLTSIKGYTDLIRQAVIGPVNEQQMEFLNVIRSNADRMATLISDLSDVSRIERGILKLEPVLVPLHGYVDETINRLRPKIEEKEQKINNKVPHTLPRVFADPNRLVQVLTNLISNAWKYTPEGGKITVQAVQNNNMILVEVIDTGIGISSEDQTKLFTQFFRAESPEVREQTGWGLGLNVTKRLVEFMGGNIGMDSKLQVGSTFWFTLPIQTPETAA
ncbi:MAG: ATP-binding protein [Anaerolineales bacterium]|nr:ATP-binding protein [Anaerolineales bacterium]